MQKTLMVSFSVNFIVNICIICDIIRIFIEKLLLCETYITIVRIDEKRVPVAFRHPINLKLLWLSDMIQNLLHILYDGTKVLVGVG